MSFALRVLVLLAAVAPLFAATAFAPSWWQTLLAAMIGSALGHLAVRLTRGRRVAAWAIALVAVTIAGIAAARAIGHTTRPEHASSYNFLVVRSKDGRSSLTWDDVRAIQTRIPSVHLAVPYLDTRASLVTADAVWNTVVIGTTPDYFGLRSMHIAAGDQFDASAADQKVVVLGETVVEQLYGATTRPVGDVLRIKGMPFTIVGVLGHQGTTPDGQDLDDVAIVPAQVFAARLDSSLGFRGAVLIMPESRAETPHLEDDLRRLLRDRHRLAPGADDDFIIRDPAVK